MSNINNTIKSNSVDNDSRKEDKPETCNDKRNNESYLGYIFGEKNEDKADVTQKCNKKKSITVMNRILRFFSYDPLVEIGISDSSSFADSDMGSMNIYEPIIYVGMPEDGLPNHLMVILTEKKKRNALLSKKRKLNEDLSNMSDPSSQIHNLKIVLENEEKRKKLFSKSPRPSVCTDSENAYKSQKEQAIDIIKEKLNGLSKKIACKEHDDKYEESNVLADIIEKINLISDFPRENITTNSKIDNVDFKEIVLEKENSHIMDIKIKRKSDKTKKTRIKRVILSPEEKKIKLEQDLSQCEDSLERELVIIETNIRNMEDGLYISKQNRESDSKLGSLEK